MVFMSDGSCANSDASLISSRVMGKLGGCDPEPYLHATKFLHDEFHKGTECLLRAVIPPRVHYDMCPGAALRMYPGYTDPHILGLRARY